MEDMFYWNVFKNVGSVDSYLLKSDHERFSGKGLGDATDKDERSYSQGYELK